MKPCDRRAAVPRKLLTLGLLALLLVLTACGPTPLDMAWARGDLAQHFRGWTEVRAEGSWSGSMYSDGGMKFVLKAPGPIEFYCAADYVHEYDQWRSPSWNLFYDAPAIAEGFIPAFARVHPGERLVVSADATALGDDGLGSIDVSMWRLDERGPEKGVYTEYWQRSARNGKPTWTRYTAP